MTNKPINNNTKFEGLRSLRPAFTLAEVLITLCVIGVVAAMTIPTIINKAEKISTISGLKKSYSMLQNMKQKAEYDNGPYTIWGLAGTTGTMTTVFNNIIAPSLNVAKFCGTTSTGCWAYGYNIDGTGGSATPSANCIYALLADGSSIAFLDRTGVYTATTVEMQIFVDLNGLKGPNRWGRDRFSFFLENDNYTDNKIAPMGNGPDNVPRAACWNSAVGPAWWDPGTGETCALTIIKFDNWQIADDYPW